MASTTAPPSSLFHFSPPPPTQNSNTKNNTFIFSTHNKPSFQPLIAYHTLSKSQSPNHTFIHPLRKPRKLKVSAVSSAEESAIIPAETAQDIVSSPSGDDGVSTIISILLFIAFVSLSILTIGVIYIAVTDFLTKREKEKFEKEEAAKKKKGGKKVATRAKAGPRGFGQKIDEDDFDD